MAKIKRLYPHIVKDSKRVIKSNGVVVDNKKEKKQNLYDILNKEEPKEEENDQF